MQKEYFKILNEIFKQSTGKNVQDFATIETFSDVIKINPKKLVNNTLKAYEWGIPAINKYYEDNKKSNFREARQIGGVKLVLGGTSRLNSQNLSAIKKMLLYTDTILVPDPILPWLEVERHEEKFSFVNLFENIFLLLHLKPIIDANLDYPAIQVFQSYEKSLEQQDPITKERIENLLINFLGYYLNKNFESIEDTIYYVKTDEEDFLNTIEKKNLFVTPESNIGQKIHSAIEAYKKHNLIWRSEDYAYQDSTISDGLIVWRGIFERLAPQWHLIENSFELSAHPLLAHKNHWHYYNLCSKMNNSQLNITNILSNSTIRAIESLKHAKFDWLGNIPWKTLAMLREEHENEDFRTKIGEYINLLNDATIDNIDSSVKQVSKGINSLLKDHSKKIKEIESKYNRKHIQTIIAAGVTASAIFLPLVSPLLNVATPVGLAVKFGLDSIHKTKDKRKLSKSLLGVLASAKSS